MTVVNTELYDRLNLLPDASKDQIRRAYHRLAATSHPDKFPNLEAEALTEKRALRASNN